MCNSVEILKKRDKFSKRLLLNHGMEGMSEVLQKLFNLAMKLERENVLKATPYQRTEGRTGYANGFKERHIQSRVGELALQIPQTRKMVFNLAPDSIGVRRKLRTTK